MKTERMKTLLERAVAQWAEKNPLDPYMLPGHVQYRIKLQTKSPLRKQVQIDLFGQEEL